MMQVNLKCAIKIIYLDNIGTVLRLFTGIWLLACLFFFFGWRTVSWIVLITWQIFTSLVFRRKQSC